MRVLVQLRPTRASAPDAAALSGAVASGGLPASFAIDTAYAPVPIPTPVAEEEGGDRFSLTGPRHFAAASEDVTRVVRGVIPDGVSQVTAYADLIAHPDVVGVFSDPVIESTIVCPGDPAVGSDADVAKQLRTTALAGKGMNGTGVTVAIVDTGFNLAYLKSKGRTLKFSAAKSWTPAGVTTKPGQHPVNHGTMCAYDVAIAAPKATFIDYAVLLSQTPGATQMAGLLSDAVLAYSKLRQVLTGMSASRRSLVVSNSWGMFSPTWDFPVGHPGNYSDNPAHPFNVIVASLEADGADILFAAGNCGRDCPDGRCNFGSTRPICGANSHPAVLSVAGIDVKRGRVGYSSQGPGRLAQQKPDIASYTHFKGSGVYPADGGTSAACPVLAGLVAAVRSKFPGSRVSPADLKTTMFKTAIALGKPGFDYDYGWGAPDPDALTAALGSTGQSGARRASASRTRRRAPARAA